MEMQHALHPKFISLMILFHKGQCMTSYYSNSILSFWEYSKHLFSIAHQSNHIVNIHLSKIQFLLTNRKIVFRFEQIKEFFHTETIHSQIVCKSEILLASRLPKFTMSISQRHQLHIEI